MDENEIFNALRDLLERQPLKIGEICDRMNLKQSQVLDVLKSNPYSFEFQRSRGKKVWKCC
jgi:hypothetical protein